MVGRGVRLGLSYKQFKVTAETVELQLTKEGWRVIRSLNKSILYFLLFDVIVLKAVKQLSQVGQKLWCSRAHIALNIN